MFADPRFRFEAAPHEYYLGERQLTSFSTWIKAYKEAFDREDQAPRTAAKRGISIAQVLAEWDRSQWVGTQTHAFIEQHYQHPQADGQSFTPTDPEVLRRCEKFLTLRAGHLRDFQPVAQELRLFHEPSGLCGTLDFLGWHVPTQQLYVLDWKTNGKIGTDRDPVWRTLRGPFADLGDHAHNVYSLQISFYRLLLAAAGIPTAGGALVHLPPGNQSATVYQAVDYQGRLRELLPPL